MIEKDYVTVDVAKTLREKGFCEKCRGFYYGDILDYSCFYNEYNKTNDASLVSAPSLSQAARWLRENHNISVEPYTNASGYCWQMCKAHRDCTCGTWLDDSTNHEDDELMNDGGSYDIYEQAFNSGIREALKLI